MPMFQAKFLGDHGAPTARKRKATLHSRGSLLGWEAAISRLTAKPTGEHHHIATVRAWPSYIAVQDMIRFPLYLWTGSPWSERNSHHHCDAGSSVNRALHDV